MNFVEGVETSKSLVGDRGVVDKLVKLVLHHSIIVPSIQDQVELLTNNSSQTNMNGIAVNKSKSDLSFVVH